VVVLFHNPDLSPARFLAFGSAIGGPVEYQMQRRLPGFPIITEGAELEPRPGGDAYRHLARG
jgi:hypothetical protein